MRTRGRIVFLFFSLLPAALYGETIVSAETDRDTITVGDPLLLTVTVRAPADEEAAVPLFPGGAIGPFEILETLPVQEEVTGGVRKRTVSFRITAFATGPMEIPSIAPAEEGTPSRAIPIQVRSVGLDPSGDIRPVKDPIPYPRNLLSYILPLSAIALLFLLGFLLYRRFRKRREAPSSKPVTPPRPAHEIAFQALRELAESGGNGDGPGREAFFRLSWIVREYLWNRYALPAPERTSREIFREMRRRALSPESKGVLRDLLRRCDLVKFRGDEPAGGELSEWIASAEQFVEMTREREWTQEGAI